MDNIETDDDTPDIEGFDRDRNDELEQCKMENDDFVESDSDND